MGPERDEPFRDRRVLRARVERVRDRGHQVKRYVVPGGAVGAHCVEHDESQRRRLDVEVCEEPLDHFVLGVASDGTVRLVTDPVVRNERGKVTGFALELRQSPMLPQQCGGVDDDRRRTGHDVRADGLLDDGAYRVRKGIRFYAEAQAQMRPEAPVPDEVAPRKPFLQPLQ